MRVRELWATKYDFSSQVAESFFGIFPQYGQGWNLTLGFTIVTMLVVFVATHFVGRPLLTTSGYGFDWVLFVTWFWIVFSSIPVLGTLIGLFRGFSLLSGNIGESTITSNGNTSTYPAVVLDQGEGLPAAVLFFLARQGRRAARACPVVGSAGIKIVSRHVQQRPAFAVGKQSFIAE